jgi:hypothetical protein
LRAGARVRVGKAWVSHWYESWQTKSRGPGLA